LYLWVFDFSCCSASVTISSGSPASCIFTVLDYGC
jgi:hypothetical protein